MVIGKRKIKILVFTILFTISVISSNLYFSSNVYATSSTVSVDYSVTKTTAGQYVFGVSSWPRMNPDYAEKLAHAGVTMLRQSSLLMANIVPTTTVANYLNNVNNVQDPSTWNWDMTGLETETMPETDVAAFQDAGIKIFAILAGTPPWLCYTGWNSVPTNWSIFTDIQKKIFDHYDDRIEYFEIFNEPEIEFDLTGSGYTDVYTAYSDMFYYSLQGINQVNTNNRHIGGPANLNTPAWLDYMLSNSNINDDLDFASWHQYNYESTYDCKIKDWKYEAADNGYPDIGTFVTEYNIYDDQIDMDSTDAISWVAGRITTLMSNGATGAFLYGTDDRASGPNAETRHAWKIINQDGTFTPRVWPIRVLSKQLGLGSGENEMKLTNYSGITTASGAVNSEGFPVAWVVNDSASSITTEINLNNTGYSGAVTLTHYLAAGGISDGSQIYNIENKYVNDNKLSTTVTVPAKSVYGIIVAQNAALGKTYSSSVSADNSYPDTSGLELTNGAFASTSYLNAPWQGRKNLSTYSYTIDLGASTSIGQLQSNFLRDDTAGISLPSSVDYSISNDNSTFTAIGSVDQPSSSEDTLNLYKLTSSATGRYVKITINGSWDSTHWCFIDEVRILKTPASTIIENLASGKSYTTTVTANASYPDTSGSELTNNVFGLDSYKDKAWQGRAGLSTYSYTIDLSSSQLIGEFQSFHYRYDSALIALPSSVVYSVSDDNNSFTTVGTVYTPDSADLSTINYSLKKNATGRYVKVVVNGSWSNSWSFINEIRILKTYTNLASGKTASASTELCAAGTAVDGLYYADSVYNCWATTYGNDVGAWWKVDLGSSYSLKVIKIQFRGFQNPSEPLWYHMTPKNLTIQVSTDNTNWTTVYSKSPNVPAYHSAYSQNLFTYEISSTARYVKIVFEDGTDDPDNYAELVEVEIY